MTNLTDELLATRGKIHGEFGEQARITQALKNVLRSSAGWERLDDAKRDAIEMICVKLGRIHAGNPDHADHYADIAGYARLVEVRVAPDVPPAIRSFAPRNRSPLSDALEAVDKAIGTT